MMTQNLITKLKLTDANKIYLKQLVVFIREHYFHAGVWCDTEFFIEKADVHIRTSKLFEFNDYRRLLIKQFWILYKKRPVFFSTLTKITGLNSTEIQQLFCNVGTKLYIWRNCSRKQYLLLKSISNNFNVDFDFIATAFLFNSISFESPEKEYIEFFIWDMLIHFCPYYILVQVSEQPNWFQYLFETVSDKSLMFRILNADNIDVDKESDDVQLNLKKNNQSIENLTNAENFSSQLGIIANGGVDAIDLAGVIESDISTFSQHLVKPLDEYKPLDNLEIDKKPIKEFNNWFLTEENMNENDLEENDSSSETTELYDYNELFVWLSNSSSSSLLSESSKKAIDDNYLDLLNKEISNAKIAPDFKDRVFIIKPCIF